MQSIPAVEIDGTQAVAEVLEAEQMISDENMAFATEDGAETEEISGSPQSDQATIMPVEITHSMIEERYPETPTGPTASTVTASAHEDGSRIRSPESEDRSADARMLMAVLRDQAETVKRKKGQTTQTQTLLDIFRSGSSAGGTIDGPVTTEEAQPVEVTEAEHPQAFEIPQPTTIKPPSSPPRHTEVLSTRSLTLLSILRSDPTPKELPAHEDFKVAALPEVAPKSLATNGSTTAQITSHKAGLTQHQSGLLSLFKDRGNFETPVELQVIESPSSQHLSSPSASSTATVRQTRSGHEARGKERDTVQSSFTSPTSSVAITNHPFAGLPLSTPQPEKKMSTATLVKKPLERTRDNSGIKSPSIVSSPRITVLSRPSDNGTGHRMSIRTPDAKAKPFEEVKGAELGLDGPSIKSRSDNPDDVSTAAPETTIPRRQNNNRPRSSRTPIVSSEKADELLSSFTRPKPSGQPRLFDPMLAQGYIQKYGPRRSQAGRNVSNSPRPSEGQPGARQASDALSTKPKVEKTEAPKAGRGDGKEMKKLMKRTSLVPEAPEQLPYKPTILRRPQMTT